MEIWKDIKGYEGLYRISNTGKVLSLHYMGGNKSRELKPKVHKKGYLWVLLRNNGKEGHYLIHRLVAEAFIENPNNFLYVNHKDENPQNNNSTNLEWCTHEYNVHYSMDRHPERINSRGNRYGIRKSNEIDARINQFSMNGTFICQYKNLSAITRAKGYDRANIYKCCRHIRKSAYGYKWEYAT